MIYLLSNSTDPRYNLALEEFLFDEAYTGETILMLWQNEPSVIMGKHQNAFEEVNSKYVEENGIHVVRRLSGGGAVYHDLGNLNFTCITRKNREESFNFREFADPIIALLGSLGVEAEFNSRNDMTINGKKFSGNAQYVKRDKVLHHGTLLFDTDISPLVRSLTISDDRIVSNSIKSVRSRVTNIREHLVEDMTVKEFQDRLIEAFRSDNPSCAELHISETDNEKILDRMNTRYSQWEWNYGKSPRFVVDKQSCTDGSLTGVRVQVCKGRIESVEFTGVCGGLSDFGVLEEKLIGTCYTRNAVFSRIAGVYVGEKSEQSIREEICSAIIS